MNADVLGESGEDGEPPAPAGPSAPTTDAVATGVSWKALSVIVGQGSWYASLFVLAILVAPRDFGVIAVGSVVVSFTTLLLESGTGGSLIIAPELDAASVRRSLIRTSVAGVGFTLLFAALAGPIADAFTGGSDPGVLRAIALTVGLAAVWIVPNALLTRFLRFKAIAQITITAAVVASVAAVIAAALGAGVWALAIRLLVNQLLLTGLSCVAARGLFPRGGRRPGPIPRRPGATAFVLIAGAGVLAWTFDNLVVGAFTNPTDLGLYSLAFSLAYAPLTQVSWAVGSVLLPAVAAARDPELVRRQTLKALRMMALMLLPLLPPAIVLAPAVIPALLGEKWRPMVVPFQILVLVGVGQGIVNVLGETLAGAGGRSVGLRARIDVVWALATISAIAVGVNLGGIRGAALAHVVTFAGLISAYAWRGGRGIGLSVYRLAGAVRGVALCVVLQGLTTLAVAYGLKAAGGGALATALVGAGAGLVALALALRTLTPELLREGRGVIRAALPGLS